MKGASFLVSSTLTSVRQKFEYCAFVFYRISSFDSLLSDSTATGWQNILQTDKYTILTDWRAGRREGGRKVSQNSVYSAKSDFSLCRGQLWSIQRVATVYNHSEMKDCLHLTCNMLVEMQYQGGFAGFCKQSAFVSFP